MTKNSARKNDIRRRMAATGEAYNAAARALDRETTELLSEPPRLYPIVTTPCTHGCDGSPHPGYVCETWHPVDRNGKPRTGWATCQAANLPLGRAQSLTDRFREKPSHGYHLDYTWVLALTYALLLDEQPDTAPNPHQLRAAVEADDLTAVDALMMPLDFAAVRLLDVPAEDWHAKIRPLLHAWATKVNTAPEDEPPVWDITRIEYGSRCLRLAEHWLESRRERRNHNGYMEIESIHWWFSVPFLTTVLMRQVGGHPREWLEVHPAPPQ
ncbi:hypothetical protein ABT352_32910 [Streptosporangium sp. NPDC000563]|uniref:hypothetical protein n=1 Tax=Streptosporangium sp. NPDC000563 TaxID=3154366 RepID=UPI0033227173